MSDLTTFRDHCRRMAVLVDVPRPRGTSWACDPRSAGTAGHGECTWGWQGCACDHHDPDRPKPPTDAERVLWTHLADEIDTWLTTGLATVAPEDHTEPLWETT